MFAVASASVAPEVTMVSVSGSTASPLKRRCEAAIAARRYETVLSLVPALPDPTDYAREHALTIDMAVSARSSFRAAGQLIDDVGVIARDDEQNMGLAGGYGHDVLRRFRRARPGCAPHSAPSCRPPD